MGCGGYLIFSFPSWSSEIIRYGMNYSNKFVLNMMGICERTGQSFNQTCCYFLSSRHFIGFSYFLVKN